MKCGTKLIIQDRYKPSKELGNGAFGKTFLAVDLGKPSQPQCVIKQFIFTSPNPSLVQKAKELFYEEAKQLEKLGKHDQIPELFGYHEQEDRLYLIQEFIDGENLLEELYQDGAFNEAKIYQVLADLLPVLEFIHSHQVIHRDIKPENIMRRRSDQKLFLIDFGAVKQTTATSFQITGTAIGSPAYQAPEHLRGRAIFSSDIYSLGVSCLQLLTNIEPLNLLDNNGEFLWRDYLLNNPVQNNLGKILDKMTKYQLRDRYKLVQEILQDINTTKSEPSYKWIDMVTGKANFLFNPFYTTSLIEKSFVQIFNTKNAGISFMEYLKNHNLLPGGVPLVMIAIPGGTFNMGSNESCEEKPIHTVTIQPFYLGEYPVTQEQYQVIMGENPSHYKGKRHPVENVNWEKAMEFCDKLSQKTGKKYRLPSEAEWEYACRAGTQTKYCFGDDEGRLQDYAWYSNNSENITHPIGQKKSNAFGLYDMHGNVWEWCCDRWHENYIGAPDNGSSWETPPKENHRVQRGGSWGNYAFNCHSAGRGRTLADISFSNIGFRVALTIS